MTRCFVLLLAIMIQCKAIAVPGEKPLAKPPKFGAITKDELEMKECSFEKSAPAMNLVQYEAVELHISPYGDIKLVAETTYRIKIFNRNGFKSASIIIPYTGKNRTSRITDIAANTYNLDEKGTVAVTEVSRKDIFRDKAAEKNGLSTVRFTFPNVKEGSVIEYRYTRIEKGSYFIAPWFFQSEIPTLFSACEITTPAFSMLQKHFVAQGTVEEGYQVKDPNDPIYRANQRSYCLRNVPSFKPEPFMASVKDNMQRVEFAVVPRMNFLSVMLSSGLSWNMFNLLFLRSPFFGEQFSQAIPGTNSFIDSLKQADSIPDKVNAVFRYVKTQLNWDHHYSFYADNLADVWKEKQANSAEINLSILNLLRKAGVDCYPILFSTRENGNVDVSFPSVSQFNSVDILVLNRDSFYILDGSGRHLSFRTPPMNILNRNAFIVDEDNSKWVKIVDARTLLKDSVSIVASLSDDGVLRGRATITYYDFSRANKLEKDSRHDDDDEDDEKEDYLATDDLDVHVDTSYQLNKDNELMPLQEVMQFHYELPSTGNFYFLNPFLFSSFRKNPFTDTGRQTDIDFGAQSSFLMHMEISLPGNIQAEELAKDKIIRTPDTTLLFKRSGSMVNHQLVVNSEFTIDQAIFDKKDYIVVSDFFRRVYGLLNEQISLKKKDE